jgi:hypothetical protein
VTDKEKRAYKYVTLMWDDYHAMTYGRFDICDPEGNMDYIKAAEFTRQRLKEIQQVEDEIRICEGCLRFWQSPLGTEYGGVVPMRRILSREQAALVELKRGMKEDMQ